MSKLKVLATGIGSLPHKDIDAALDLIFKYVPKIPFWPQLPKRDIREGMVAQFSESFPCLKVAREELFFDPANKDEALEIFYERIITNNTDHFKISPDFALGLHKFYQRLQKTNLKEIEFIKCQITGPFTFAASIKDDLGRSLLHEPVLMQVIIKGLVMKALWQIKLFQQFGKKIILFIDEPYLGCFGSAYTPINREDVVKGLSELTAAIKAQGVLTGVHCCGNTDWSIFTDISSIDIISFDAFAYLEKLLLYPNQLRWFLNRGGILCWGIVPTQEFTGKENAMMLGHNIENGINMLVSKGLNKNALLENLFISPSCGLGTLDIDKSEKIIKLLSETAFVFQKLF